MATILLVDDNPLRASLRQSILEGSVSAVVRVSDAAEALCLVESPEFASSLRLVITGHTGSGIPGPDFAAELRARLPHVPVLILSAQGDVEREYAGIGGLYHSKTLSPDELRSAVNRLLGAMTRQSA
jgi:DNA-binding response OmpR family regulator